jgi:hypothetical protein
MCSPAARCGIGGYSLAQSCVIILAVRHGSQYMVSHPTDENGRLFIAFNAKSQMQKHRQIRDYVVIIRPGSIGNWNIQDYVES